MCCSCLHNKVGTKIFYIYILHVGSVTNKGTYALLKSDVSEIKRMFESAEIHISTSDVETLRYLEPTLQVHPLLVDIPYERADLKARKSERGRETLRYKFHVLVYVIMMVLQALLSIISSLLAKVNLRPIYRSEVIRRIRDSNLIVSASDENFKEGSMYLPFNIYWKLAGWSVLFSRMCDIVIAKKIFNKPVVVFPNSVGPFRTWLGRFMARMTLNNVDSLLLRESLSYSFLKDLKIKTPMFITSDITVLFESHQTQSNQTLPKPAVGVSPGLCAITFSANAQSKYVSAHSRVLDCLIEKYGFNVTFLPHEISGLKSDDLELCKAMLRHMIHKNKVKIIKVKTPEEYKNYLEQLDLLITSRMHPAVLACSSYVPTVGILYDHKQVGFFNQLGLSECIINVNKVSYERLLSKIELVWNNRERIKHQLLYKIPELQKDVRTKIRRIVSNFKIRTC